MYHPPYYNPPPWSTLLPRRAALRKPATGKHHRPQAYETRSLVAGYRGGVFLKHLQKDRPALRVVGAHQGRQDLRAVAASPMLVRRDEIAQFI